MIKLRLIINNHQLTDISCYVIQHDVIIDSYCIAAAEFSSLPTDAILEIYLAPQLMVVRTIDIGTIARRKITDTLLLSTLEESIADDIENCKPILLELMSGERYVAIMQMTLYLALQQLTTKNIVFIQSIVYATRKELDMWTVNLQADYPFVRTSLYEYHLLDNAIPVPQLLLHLLAESHETKILLYGSITQAEYLTKNCNIKCELIKEMNYGAELFNINATVKPIPISQQTKQHLKRLLAATIYFMLGLVMVGLIKIGILVFTQQMLKYHIARELATDFHLYSFSSLVKIRQQFTLARHSQHQYAPTDACVMLLNTLSALPTITGDSIMELTYNNDNLVIMLNDSSVNFTNVSSILKTKGLKSNMLTYDAYLKAKHPAATGDATPSAVLMIEPLQ